ncbi:DeoR family glycerol-3-phosphate regulon repressor [Natronocella acetinitrilica]|uniref:DeoR family glycerol-3-phosphate regulon repressor n=1 Tax=Natronocella acetinitrilica TaxID=414046 RepID=A0AAE3KBM0_9GAMM|nr:DeoR family transcriptional regulator [Natronocella acetinitrilica]MCP1674899.1 DeoR family glycerol-3-phosphate regulon repressor [Natronocella acetinitrilica]
MDLNRRQQQMLSLVRQQGFVSVEGLAQHFDVTAQTIRRDINSLCEFGLLRRYHGGAGLPSSVENAAYSARQVLWLEQKRRIAQAVAAAIPDQASLFITLGTTTEEVAKALLDRRDLRVITNNLNVASIMSGNPTFDVIITGGVVRNRDRGVIGEAAIDFIRQFKADYAVIGISGIDQDGTLLDFDYREVRVQQAIIEHSRRVMLVTDHSKFGRNALVRLGDVTQIDTLFTDREPPAAIRALMEEHGRHIHVAGVDAAFSLADD